MSGKSKGLLGFYPEQLDRWEMGNIGEGTEGKIQDFSLDILILNVFEVQVEMLNK